MAVFERHDLATEQGRSSERHRKIVLTAAAAAIAKAVQAGSFLISVPLTLQYLGPERFGLWMTISSVIVMLGFADLGIGNGLLNAVSEASGKGDNEAIRRYISSAFFILGGIALGTLAIFLLAYPFISWASLFNVKSPLAAQESGYAVLAFILCFVLNIPAGIVQRTQMGLQMGFVAHIWQIAGGVLSLLAILLAIHLQLSLPWLVFALAGTPVLVAALNGMLFFGGARPDVRPAKRFLSREAMRKVTHAGLLFLVLQIAAAAAFASDNIVIARMLGPEAVTQYAVPEKMFSVVPMLLGMILMPLWPAYGEAMAKGDGRWVRTIFGRSLKIALAVASILAFLLGYFAADILSLWVGHQVSPPLMLLLGMAVWKVFEGWGMAVGVFLNGANIVRLQAALATLMAVLAITLKIALIGPMGVAGVVWATIIAYVTVTFVPLSLVIPRLLRRFEIAK